LGSGSASKRLKIGAGGVLVGHLNRVKVFNRRLTER